LQSEIASSRILKIFFTSLTSRGIKMVNKLFTTVSVFMIITVNTAFANDNVTVSYTTGNKSYFSFEVPDDWKINVGFEVDPAKIPKGEVPKPRMISAMPNDGTRLWFAMWVPKSVTNLKKAKEYLAQFRGFDVENSVEKKVKKSKVNGMDVTTFLGQGEREGKIVDIAVVVFQLTRKNMGIAIYIAPPEVTKIHSHELNTMVKSIRPAG